MWYHYMEYSKYNQIKFSKNKPEQNLRIIVSCNIYTSVSKLQQTLNFLNLDNIYDLELAKIMHQLKHQKSPKVFIESFAKIEIAPVYYTTNFVYV